MIQSIRHKGLYRLYRNDDACGVIQDHSGKLRDMDVPGLRLHSLGGKYKGFWAVTVRSNWRIVFRFADGHAFNVDYLDYH